MADQITTSRKKLIIKPESSTAKFKHLLGDKVKIPKIRKAGYSAASRVKHIFREKPFIKPESPALISQQISKAKRIPFIIVGAVIALYMLFKKGRKGGKK